MTSYFDDIGSELRRVGQDLAHAGEEDFAANHRASDALEAIEERLVRDVTLCVEMPGCPEKIRDAVHRTVLAHGVVTLPTYCVHAGFDTTEEHLRAIEAMGGALHSIFHDLAGRGIHGFSDSPLTPLRVLYGVGDERRYEMIRTGAFKVPHVEHRPPKDDELPRDVAPEYDGEDECVESAS